MQGGIVMPESSLDALEALYPQVVASMERDDFDSHEFILQLAHDYQRLYVKALAAYADTDRPFQIVHGEIAKRLLKHGHLVVKTGETISKDIFGQENTAAAWRRVKMGEFIELPYGGAGTGFHGSELIDHIRSTGRDYIIQGQQHCALESHPKPHSLDVWLRKGFTYRKDTAQAVNQVVKALVATGRFEVDWQLLCPDSGRRCKGLRLLNPS
jgi:hypothetical protein